MDLASPRSAIKPLAISKHPPFAPKLQSNFGIKSCAHGKISALVAVPKKSPFPVEVSCSGSYISPHFGNSHLPGSSISSRIHKHGQSHERNTSDKFHRLIGYSSSNWWRSSYGNYDSDDNIDPYPWEASNLEFTSIPGWLNQEMVTFFTTDGIIRFPGSYSSRIRDSKESITWKFKEEDFMDPHQLLCLGALFDISAVNGLDSTRRFCVQGFCRSVDMLSAVVEDSVKMQGGQIVIQEKKVNEGNLEERLRLTVSVPLLFGVPPAVENLSRAIKHGGGIVDKVYMQWQLF